MVDKYKILVYRQEDEAKYQEEVANLTIRGQNAIRFQELTDWRTFYRRFLIDRNFWEYTNFRNIGKNTQEEVLAMARRILNKDGLYTKELEKFESEKRLLIPHASSLMKRLNLFNFEPFFYQIVIEKKYFDFEGWTPFYLPQFYGFIESYCAYLGVEAPKKNDRGNSFFPKKNVEKMEQMFERRFKEKFADLSQSTKRHLYVHGNSDYDSFYNTYISYISPLNDIYNKLGESALLEVIRFGQMLVDYKKELEVEGNKEV